MALSAALRILLLLPCVAAVPVSNRPAQDGPLGSLRQDGNLPQYEVFLVPHSHCDPTWKSNYRQYYDTTVRGILEAVVRTLWLAPGRRFAWADTSFLALWMAREGERRSRLSTRARWQALAGARNTSTSSAAVDEVTWRGAFRELVDAGQIEVIHGGWVQHDEGLSSLSDTIDMMDLGRRYVESLLGRRTRIAWQIDSFGHTSSTPALLKRLGYRAVFLTRVPQIAMQKLRRSSRLEGMWGQQRAQPGERVDAIFVHIPYDGTYAFPAGFDVEKVETANLDDQIERFVAHVRRIATGFPSRKIMLMWGDDMRYKSEAAAERQFRMGEVLMGAINDKLHLKMRVGWATPSEYLNAAHPTILNVSHPTILNAARPTTLAPNGPSAFPPAPRLEDVDQDLREDASGDALPYNDDKDVTGLVSLGLVWDNYWSGTFSVRLSEFRCIQYPLGLITATRACTWKIWSRMKRTLLAFGAVPTPVARDVGT